MTHNPEFAHDEERVSPPKVVRVILQLSDGTIQYIEGDDAKEFDSRINDALLMNHIHGAPEFPTLTWINVLANDLSEVVTKPVIFSEPEEKS